MNINVLLVTDGYCLIDEGEFGYCAFLKGFMVRIVSDLVMSMLKKPETFSVVKVKKAKIQ